MPHNHHEILFLKLAALTAQVRLALKDADPEVLMALADDHQLLMDALQEAGISGDRQLLDQVQTLSRQVMAVMTEIRQRQQEVSGRIRQLADGKKMVQAYVN